MDGKLNLTNVLITVISLREFKTILCYYAWGTKVEFASHGKTWEIHEHQNNVVHPPVGVLRPPRTWAPLLQVKKTHCTWKTSRYLSTPMRSSWLFIAKARCYSLIGVKLNIAIIVSLIIRWFFTLLLTQVMITT